MPKKPYFLITIDTEGNGVDPENARFLPRFQSLCERFSFKPTYLTNYEMVMDEYYRNFARDVIKRNQGEVGTHCHAWSNPPIYNITENDTVLATYLIDYPSNIIRDKFIQLHNLLEETFSIPMRSHRAGRWALNSEYAQLLEELGYWVDCSVTPNQNWAFAPGGAPKDVGGKGGADYSHFPEYAYFMDIKNIHLSGDSNLLQIPMSVRAKHSRLIRLIKTGIDKVRGKPRPPSTLWIRPKGGNLKEMCSLTQNIINEGSDYIEFMIHSSELMPAKNQTFKSEAAIEALYQELEAFFTFLSSKVQGATLSEYYLAKCKEQNNPINQRK